MNVKNLLIFVFTVLCYCCIGPASAADIDPADEVLTTEASSGMTEAQTVNINEADAETLARILKGVGMSKAQAIVQYREENGRFYSVEELSAVRGIGMATVSKNEDRITVE